MLGRARCLSVAAAVLLGTPAFAEDVPEAPEPDVHRLRLFADTDDDDRDGRADRESATAGEARDAVWFEAPRGQALSVRSITGGGVRLIAGAEVRDAPATASRIGLQGIGVGEALIDFGDRSVHALVCEARALDMRGNSVDLARSHASISRVLPRELSTEGEDYRDDDALRWLIACPGAALPTAAVLDSHRPDGRELDTVSVVFEPGACPPDLAQYSCGFTRPIRLSVDPVDRGHPTCVDASILAEVGGVLTLRVEGKKAASMRVGGPRETALGPLERYKASLVFHLVRAWPGGEPPVGGTPDEARAMVLREVRSMDAIWGQCGIVFSPLRPTDVRIVDPPPPHLIAVGCNTGLPASGGRLGFSVDDKPVRLDTLPTETPLQVARRVAQAIREMGYVARESVNAKTSPAAFRTVDVLVRRRDGTAARLAGAGGPLSTDTTLNVCVGEVDLSDGLDHFGDLDAVAGTLEERTLIKALQDDDPSTIDVFVIGSFSRTGRIGESFIDADRSSVQNAVIVDRAGIRAGVRSYALAHELGHVLLDMPGHPDDFGVDRPWMLMDADAADPTIFGPRRLPVSDCERAIRQSGPGAELPLLRSWPLIEGQRVPTD
jgi:hypothetical protein